MGTGFIPADFVGPITLTIYSIDGQDFLSGAAAKSGICPPAGWNDTTNTPAWTSADPFPDIFLTLTPMMELEETLSATVTHYASDASEAGIHGLTTLLTVLLVANLHWLWR
jgi:hypothetical protein